MLRRELLEIAQSVLSLPTAPYHEHGVRAFVEAYARQLDLPVERDPVGNLIVKYRRGKCGAPLVWMAHMDHPGFEGLGGRRAEFLGGVPKECFPGARVRFGNLRTKVRRVLPGRRRVVELAAPVGRGELGGWDVPLFAVRGGMLRALALDDLLNVAVLLAGLTELKRRRVATEVWAVLTRAEEVGFHGAIELAMAGRIPRESLVVSFEMSKRRPWARIGGGPVVRVGDRLSTFDAAGVYFLQEVARRSAISAQRCLMDGGSCEATALNAFGYRACGLCLAMGNYHNIGSGRKIRPEFVSVNDLVGLLELAVAAARSWPRREEIGRTMRGRMEKLRAAMPRSLEEK